MAETSANTDVEITTSAIAAALNRALTTDDPEVENEFKQALWELVTPTPKGDITCPTKQ